MPDERPFTLRQADQIRGDLYALQDDLDFIKVQLAHLPTRNEVRRAAMLGMIGGAVATVTLIGAFACGGPDAVSNMQWQTEIAAMPSIELVRQGCGWGWHRGGWRDRWGYWH